VAIDEFDPAEMSAGEICSAAGIASPTAILGTDQVDGEELWVKVNGEPLDVTAEPGIPGIARGCPFELVSIIGGSGGTGGKSFGRGGISRTSRTPLAPADVQLEEPENDSEPSTPVGSVVLPLRTNVCIAEGRESPLGGLF
jgi:hypothetical protein